MIALWVVLGVLLLVAAVVGFTVVPRRRRLRRERTPPTSTGPPQSAVAGPTVLEPPVVEPPVVEPPVVEPPVVEGAPPEPAEGAAAPPPETITPEEEAAVRPELRERLGKTRGLLSGYVRSLRSRGSVDERSWEDLEEALLRADVGFATTTLLMKDLRSRVRKGELRGVDAVLSALREDLKRALESPEELPAEPDGTGRPADQHIVEVWLFVGVNGVGKTTTIGKVARSQKVSGRSVLLAAGDTFRAAAAEQLTTWGERVHAEVVRGAEGADPSAVVFDAVRRADSRGYDLVLADTAGRLHTKVNLIEELKKIRRVADRPPGKVTEVLLVLDATTGQNGVAQARQFLEAVGVTGVVLTKLDGTAKGGVVVAIRRELGLPVKLVGVGEGVDDLVPFVSEEFVDALFD